MAYKIKEKKTENIKYKLKRFAYLPTKLRKALEDIQNGTPVKGK